MQGFIILVLIFHQTYVWTVVQLELLINVLNAIVKISKELEGYQAILKTKQALLQVKSKKVKKEGLTNDLLYI